MKKNWVEKLENAKPAVVKVLDKNFAGMKSGQRMLLPSPQLIDRYITAIPFGEERSVQTMRDELAKSHKADVTCPIATGFMLKTVAEATHERLSQDGDLANITPIWRLLSPDSKTLKKVSFDHNFVTERRAAEGISDDL